MDATRRPLSRGGLRPATPAATHIHMYSVPLAYASRMWWRTQTLARPVCTRGHVVGGHRASDGMHLVRIVNQAAAVGRNETWCRGCPDWRHANVGKIAAVGPMAEDLHTLGS